MSEWFTRRTLGELVDGAAARYGEREALMHEGARYSFAALRDDVDRAAKALMALGIEPGDKVALWMPNRVEWLHIFFGLAKIGAVAVPLNTRLRTADIEYVVRQSDSRALITVDRSGPVDYLEMVCEVWPSAREQSPEALNAEGFPELRHLVILGDESVAGTRSWAEVLAGADAVSDADLEARASAVDPDDTVMMMYTSGTTGFPKGVMHNHNVQRTVIDAANRMGVTARDVILMYLPLFHCFGLYDGPFTSLVTGARVVLTTTFDGGEALRLIEQERATLMSGFDTHFHDIVNHADIETTDVSSLRTGTLAVGMASSEPVARRAQEVLCPTVTAWGMTEVGVGATRSFLDSPVDDRCEGSGHPLPGYELIVVDPETGEQVPPDGLGELLIRGYAIMQGYYRKPEETAQAIDGNGWFHTGDLVQLRDDGRLRFLGRYKDLLKVGGENVDPAEVEQFLLDHPDVERVAVVGVPDPRMSEVPCACVVPRAGATPSNDELVAFCRGKLASFKLPRYTLLLDDLPMTSSGKIQKFRLREAAERELKLVAV